jgi:choline-glycine betaine transporter
MSSSKKSLKQEHLSRIVFVENLCFVASVAVIAMILLDDLVLKTRRIAPIILATSGASFCLSFCSLLRVTILVLLNRYPARRLVRSIACFAFAFFVAFLTGGQVMFLVLDLFRTLIHGDTD